MDKGADERGWKAARRGCFCGGRWRGACKANRICLIGLSTMAMAGARRMGLLTIVPFLSSLPSSGVLAQSPYGKVVIEPFTGIEFEQEKQIDESDFHLHATAVRCMLGKCNFAMARAYAVGLYTDENHPVDATAVLTGAMRRSLVLVMDKDVAGHHIGKGFDRSLIPRIRKAQAGSKKGTGKDALRQFTNCFNRLKMLQKGSEVTLLWTPDDKLVVYIDNRSSEEVKGVVGEQFRKLQNT